MDGLIITLREGIEAALVIGILLAYLAKTGKTHLNKYVYAGLASAVVASLMGAVALNLIGIDPENEFIEGVFFFTSAIFVASMVIWMWRTGRFISQKITAKLDSITTEQQNSVWQAIGLFGFTFFMVFREGIETVLFLTALSFAGASQTLTFAGAVLGLILAVAFGVAFIKGSLKINLKRFFEVTGFVLLVLAVKLFASGIHEWTEVGILPVISRLEFAIIGLIVRESTDIAIIIGLLVLPAILIISSYFKKEPSETIPAESSAEQRKIKAKELQQKRWVLIGFGLILTIILVLSSAFASIGQIIDPLPTKVTVRENQIKIPFKTLKNKQLTKFFYEADGTKVRFILVRQGKSVSSGFDACEVCGPSGYSQNLKDLSNIICKNCNAPIPLSTIGQPGGCNPMVLPARLIGNEIVVKAEDLVKAKKIFNGSL